MISTEIVSRSRVGGDHIRVGFKWIIQEGVRRRLACFGDKLTENRPVLPSRE